MDWCGARARHAVVDRVAYQAVHVAVSLTFQVLHFVLLVLVFVEMLLLWLLLFLLLLLLVTDETSAYNRIIS